MKKINLHLLTALAAMAFFAACADHFAPPAASGKLPPAKGMGRVEIRIAGTEARTFLPDISGITGMALDYKLIVTKDGADTPSVDVTFSGNNWIGDLDPGNYTVEIIARRAGTSQTMARGYERLTVVGNTANSISVAMKTSDQGNGVFSYSINVMENAAITNGGIQFVSLSGGADPATRILSNSNLNGSITIASGYYRVNLSLADTAGGEVKLYETTAVAYIAENFTTTAVYNVTGDDFVRHDGVVADSAGLNAALADIRTKPAGEYVIRVAGVFSSAPIELSTGLQNKTIVLQGIGSAEITLSSRGSLFTVGMDSLSSGTIRSVTLILENITLRGINNNSSVTSGGYDGSLVLVYGKLVLRNGGKITGNTNIGYIGIGGSGGGGGGILVNGGTLEIVGGEISFNTANIASRSDYRYGGGVWVRSGGTVLMNGGVIKGNKVIGNLGAYGGGVSVSSSGSGSSSFEMNGGVIEGNTATFEGKDAYGGGVYVYSNGTFTMSGGTISGNTANSGGGVYNSGTFRIVNGTIYGSNETDTSLRNTVGALGGTAAAQRGIFSGATWTSKATLYLTNNTIKVVNGELQ